MARAIEEVKARVRDRSNPFVSCASSHDVLLMMRRQTKAYYSTFDPRVGLRVSALLYRYARHTCWLCFIALLHCFIALFHCFVAVLTTTYL
jgi:hypothetical protein